MCERAPRHASLLLPLILPLLSLAFFPQELSSSSANQAAQTVSQSATRGKQSSPANSVSADPDLELAAIVKAQREGRLLDAEKLLHTALAKGRTSLPDWRKALLLNRLASVESELGRYAQAITAEQRALVIQKKLYTPTSTVVLIDLSMLSRFNLQAGNRTAANRAAVQAVALARKFPGPHEETLATALWNAALNSEHGHRPAQARAFLMEGVRICQAPGALRTNICPVILSHYYRNAGRPRYAEEVLSNAAAQPAPRRYRRTDHGPQLNALGLLAAQYEREGSYDLAETTLRREIRVAETEIPNPLVAPGIYEQLGRDLELEGNSSRAEAAYKHAFDTLERLQGEFHSAAIERLPGAALATLYEKEGRTSNAEAVLQRMLADQEQALDPNDSRLARTLVRLAELGSRQGDYAGAAQLCERALTIQEADYGQGSPRLIPTLRLYSRLARQLGEKEKAAALAARTRALREKGTKPASNSPAEYRPMHTSP